MKVLAVLHWVVAVFAGLMSLLPLLYVGMGAAMVHGMLPPGGFSTRSGQVPPFEPFGWFMVAFGAIFSLGFLAFAVALAFAASSYSQRRRWTYCVVVAALCCAWFPFGTVLGVFSILVLARPETKALFGEGRPVALTSGAPGPDERAPFS